MSLIEQLRALLAHYYFLFSWRDAVEIFIFAYIFYAFSIWIKNDKQKNLLPYFYTYCVLAFGSYYIELYTLSTFLFICAPIVLMIFILVHQKQLQKNFVTLHKVIPATTGTLSWLDMVMRTALSAINNNKTFCCVFEHRNNLQDLMTTPLRLNTPLHTGVLNTLVASNVFNEQKMVWLTTTGTVVGINTMWKASAQEEWVSAELKQLHQWQQDAILVTKKTDALVIRITPENRTFAVVIGGTVVEELDVQAAIQMVKRYLKATESPDHKGEYAYESQSQRNTAGKRPH